MIINLKEITRKVQANSTRTLGGPKNDLKKKSDEKVLKKQTISSYALSCFSSILGKKVYEIRSADSVVAIVGEAKEFPVILIKEANGEKISTIGTARYNLKNLLNMELSVIIPQEFDYDIVLKNPSNEILSNHEFRVKSSHGAVGREVNFLVNTAEESSNKQNFTVAGLWKYRNSEVKSAQFSFDFYTRNILNKTTGKFEDSENLLNYQDQNVAAKIMPSVRVRDSDFYVRLQTADNRERISVETDYHFYNQIASAQKLINTNFTVFVYDKRNNNATLGLNYTIGSSDYGDAFRSSLGKFLKFKLPCFRFRLLFFDNSKITV